MIDGDAGDGGSIPCPIRSCGEYIQNVRIALGFLQSHSGINLAINPDTIGEQAVQGSLGNGAHFNANVLRPALETVSIELNGVYGQVAARVISMLLSYHRISRDGRCLFRAVAHVLFGDEEKWQSVLDGASDYLMENFEYYQNFFTYDLNISAVDGGAEQERTLEEHVQAVRGSQHNWPGYTFVAAIANKYYVHMRLITNSDAQDEWITDLPPRDEDVANPAPAVVLVCRMGHHYDVAVKNVTTSISNVLYAPGPFVFTSLLDAMAAVYSNAPCVCFPEGLYFDVDIDQPPTWDFACVGIDESVCRDDPESFKAGYEGMYEVYFHLLDIQVNCSSFLHAFYLPPSMEFPDDPSPMGEDDSNGIHDYQNLTNAAIDDFVGGSDDPELRASNYSFAFRGRQQLREYGDNDDNRVWVGQGNRYRRPPRSRLAGIGLKFAPETSVQAAVNLVLRV